MSAEQGLGILGSPYYFYVMRTHKTFGYIVFLFEETNARIPSDARGATPFDTGGLWLGVFHPVKGQGRKSLFAREEVTLERWKPQFLSYMNSNYSDAVDYVDGKPPAFGIAGITNQKPTNKARAWTWEVRYPSALAASRLRLYRAYMRRDDHEAYLYWLPRGGHDYYEDDEIEQLRTLAESKVEVHGRSSARTMADHPAEVALRELI